MCVKQTLAKVLTDGEEGEGACALNDRKKAGDVNENTPSVIASAGAGTVDIDAVSCDVEVQAAGQPVQVLLQVRVHARM